MLNDFDMQLKGLFYPNLMFIENALKNYVLEATLVYSQSENLQEVFNKSLTYYKEFKTGTAAYKKEFKRKMDLQMKINSALIRDYMSGKDIESHFYENGREVPVWAAFESLSLGEFGTFFACSNKTIRLEVSKLLKLPTNLNADGFLLKDIIFVLKDLRNAIAHNGIIFDTRFATSGAGKNIEALLENELKIKQIDFNFIISYVALVCYLLKQLDESKRIKSFVNEYQKIQKMTEKLPVSQNLIFGTQDKAIAEKLHSLCK